MSRATRDPPPGYFTNRRMWVRTVRRHDGMRGVLIAQYAWTKETGSLFAYASAVVMQQSADHKWDHIVFTGSASPLFAAIAGKCVYRPGTNARVGVLDVGLQFGERVFIHEVVKDPATGYSDCRIWMFESPTDGLCSRLFQ